MHFLGKIETPIGQMTAIVNRNGALVRLDFVGDTRAGADWQPPGALVQKDDAVAHVAAQIAAYFRRELKIFRIPLAPAGNVFLQEAWSQLAKVPYGTTITYGDLAQRLDKPTSARAIGRANAINPISIIVPCHRVIGANGKLTGYSGGLEKKAALLRLENVNAGWDGHDPARLL
ncbi:methylated-DNA--[protein]-cysteine S-methyltransferase [Ochrobactrum sp. Marseille-Q0166]|uniref:methylated-DNA--[protein]-cysteine S-methyltransferase n=1 Tax=Ochrobactrum sp. Marseille-Q0166 TaxID=2761105 RepID=UPI002493D708|nr:methylated-DNA--[protein]-cysteine S-methyltransferase [Ochrobactrum sp. Marseille-Q0166]